MVGFKCYGWQIEPKYLIKSNKKQRNSGNIIAIGINENIKGWGKMCKEKQRQSARKKKTILHYVV